MFRTSIAQSHRGFCNIKAKRCTAHYPIEISASCVSVFGLLAMKFFQFSFILHFEKKLNDWMLNVSQNEWWRFTEMNVQKKFHHGVLQSFFIILFIVVVVVVIQWTFFRFWIQRKIWDHLYFKICSLADWLAGRLFVCL